MYDPTKFLKSLFEAAVSAADPTLCLPPHLERVLATPPKGRTVVLGAGKAGGAMARAVEDFWTAHYPERPLEGLVVTRYGHGVACDRIEVARPLIQCRMPLDVPPPAAYSPWPKD